MGQEEARLRKLMADASRVFTAIGPLLSMWKGIREDTNYGRMPKATQTKLSSLASTLAEIHSAADAIITRKSTEDMALSVEDVQDAVQKGTRPWINQF